MKDFVYKNRDIICVILSTILAIVAVILEHFYPINKYGLLAIFVVSYVICGHKPIFKAINNIFHLEFFDENFLMTIASIGAFVIGKPLEAVSVMVLYNIGELFQKNAIKRSKNSINEVVNLRSDFAEKLEGDIYTKTAVEDVKVGDIIRIKAGEKIPLDGKIISGSTTINMSILTGESLPQDKTVGDNVLSGSINIGGIIDVEVTKLVEDSTASKIIELIENASASKSKSENFVSKFAKIYTPIVIVLAFVVGIIPPLFDKMWSVWIYRAMSFLVISCPCSVVISVPLAYFCAIGTSAKNGILIKGGGYLDKLREIDTFVFDKTGTLTKGNFVVKNVEIYGDKEEFYSLISTMESVSNHPIAKVIATKYSNYVDKNSIDNIEEKAGNGLVGLCNNDKIIVGKYDFLIENNVILEKANEVGSVVYLAKNTTCLGYIVVVDELKNGANNVINKLNSNGKNTIMLTGDNKETAQLIQQQINIKSAYSNLLPQDKLEIVDKLIEDKNKVCYVGDGINDAPVLSRADVSIAMGNGSDIAVEFGDIVLLNGDINKLDYLNKVASKTNRIVLENIIFSILIKIVVMILSTLGITSMWLAIFSDVGVMMLCVLNSIRLLVNKQNK